MRRHLYAVASGFLFGLAILGAQTVFGENKTSKETANKHSSDALQPITPRSKKAGNKGIKWLLKVQKTSGAWSCEPDSPPSVAITSLAMLSLLSRGVTVDGSGKRSKALRKGLDWLLNRPAHGRGFVTTYDATGLGPIYDHASAVLLLSQIHGQSRYRMSDVKRTLEASTRFLGKLQRSNGGWGQKRSNLGITGAVYQALRSANSSGINVNADLNQARQFTKRCRLTGGGYSITPGKHNNRRYWASSAGLRILMGIGNQNAHVQKSLEELHKTRLGKEHDGKISEWDYAGLLMLVQAMLHERGSYWAAWYPMIRKQLLNKQNTDGSWEVEYCKECRGFATSVAVLFLRAPYLLLPIFQR